MLRQHVLDALERIGARRRRELTLNDRNLVGLALAEVDDGGRRLSADLDPIRTDEDGRRVARTHVDLHHVDPGRLRLLQQFGVGLDVRVVGDDHVRFFRDQVGERLSARIRAPIRVAHHDLDAERLQFALNPGKPPLRQIEAHRHRQIGNDLPLQGFEIGLAKRLLQALSPHRKR